MFCWFGAAGLVYGASVSRRLRAVTVFGALFLGLYLLFVPTTRYAYLFMAFLMLGTAFLLCEGLRMLRSAFRPRRSDAPAASAGGRGDLLGAQG